MNTYPLNTEGDQTKFVLLDNDEAKDDARKILSELIDDEVDRVFYDLEDETNDRLNHAAAERAARYLERVLAGDEEATNQLFGIRDNDDSGRRVGLGCNKDEPWSRCIHGEIFETSAVALRRKLVEAHSELLTNERIKDLESVVEGLRLQLVKYGIENDRPIM